MKTLARSAILAALAASALTVTACTAGGSTPAPTTEGGLIPVSVVESPILDFAPYWVAQDQGYFEDEGLDVTGDLGGATSSQAVIPLVVSGTYQVGASDLVSTGIAVSKDLPYRSFATLTARPDNPDTSSIAVISRVDGPASFSELGEGDAVGVLGLGSVQQAVFSEAIDAGGGDADAVAFQNVPLQTAAELVASGDLEAAYVVEPFLTAALQNPELRVLGTPEADFYPGAPSQTVAATPDWIGSEAAVGFSAALARGVEWINDPANAEARDRIIADRAGIDLAVLKTLRLPTYSSELDVADESAQTQWRIGQDYGVISADLGLDAVIQLPGQTG